VAQHLNTLWQAVSTISDIRAMTRRQQTYYFSTLGAITFYLRAENAEVQVIRWGLPKVEVNVTLHGAFGWRVAADQDEAGVYVVARRRALVGGLSRALFTVIVPHSAFLMLHVDDGRVVMEHVNGVVEIPPVQAGVSVRMLPSGQ
jgi:hypothetical protein